MKHPGNLPRLDPSFYSGTVYVHWTLPIFNRATGWLTEGFHLRFRELLLHAAARERLLCPVYCMMPDHIHLVWMGLAEDSDQRNGMAFLRTYAEKLLQPARFQPQAYDHVLQDHERERGAFVSTVHYILENPVRAGLADDAAAWRFTGSVVPGYPTLHPAREKFWDVFWRVHGEGGLP